MSTDKPWETTDILICGCGPTGAMLSGYLNIMDVRNIVLEKEAQITTDPRGIALDDDGIRYLQGLGLYQHVFGDIGSFLQTKGYTGHAWMITHKQPILEKHLRSVIQGSRFSTLRTDCTLSSIREDEEWVYASYVNSNGSEKYVRARFLVGADGKTGFVRKHYLEPRGVKMEWAEQSHYEETWVALNWEIRLPTRETHPDFALWEHDYTPEEVYNLFFPREFRFLCNPSRAAVCTRFGQHKDRLWRFEFVVQPGEDPEEMAQEHRVKEVVLPYLRHHGRRYGLTKDVEFPEDCIRVLRSRPFRFAARKCNKWALGRVILCGDAAHVFPPFAGQGIASGFRDAIGLAWRLAIIMRSKSSQVAVEKHLTAWYTERQQQFQTSLNNTLRNGQLVSSKNPVQNFIRDWALWVMRFIPSLEHRLQLGPKLEGPVQYSHEAGMPFLPGFNGGVYFPQIYCVKLGAHEPDVLFTDDVIFSKGKANLFQVVVLLGSSAELPSAMAELDGIDQISGHLGAKESTMLVPEPPSDSSICITTGDFTVYRAATADEFARSELCSGRPTPRGYDPSQMRRMFQSKRYVIVRPDRFVYAACATRTELEQAARGIVELFPLE
ncbi:putative monooxygenase [Aspergillus affinis]|uniref:putative monooxygenase n=1 Tax=Aspergillus affinis TaxID=1070780 RepID=UPI0022FDC7C3|nr:monooxygenase [Aspergillus affinis]KAI9035136.1 monooxygenase [Aspergillus affinis]